MKKLINQLFKESSIYGLSSIISRAIAMVLVPLYTRELSPADYGLLGLIDSGIYFLVLFTGLSLDNSAARWYFDNDSDERQKSTISTWFTFVTLTTLIATILLILFKDQIAVSILKTPNSKFVLIPALTILASRVPAMVNNLFRFKRKPWYSFTFTLSFSLLIIALNIYFIIYLKLGVIGILYANLIANTVATVLVIILMSDWFSFKSFDKGLLIQMLKFSLPLVPTAVAFWLLNSASNYFILEYENKTELGLFQIGFKISALITIFLGAFQSAWPAFAYSIQYDKDSKRVYAFVFLLYSSLFSFLALCVSLFAKEILIIFTQPEYYSASFIAGLLSFNTIIYGSASIVSIGLGIKKQTKQVGLSIILGAIISLILFLILIPRFGINGAAISTIIGYMFIIGLIVYYNQKINPMPFQIKSGIMFYIFAFSLFLLYSYFFQNRYDILSIFTKIIIIIAYLVLSFYIVKRIYPLQVKKIIGNVNIFLQGKK